MENEEKWGKWRKTNEKLRKSNGKRGKSEDNDEKTRKK